MDVILFHIKTKKKIFSYAAARLVTILYTHWTGNKHFLWDALVMTLQGLGQKF